MMISSRHWALLEQNKLGLKDLAVIEVKFFKFFSKAAASS